MGLFRPYEQGQTAPANKKNRQASGDSAESATTDSHSAADRVSAEPKGGRAPSRKTGPTPSREDARAARMERLHPTMTKRQAKIANRRAQRESRLRTYQDTDNAPERSLLRDYIDHRWSITEFLLPGMLVILAISMAGAGSLLIQQVTSLVMLGVFILWIGNIVMFWTGYKKELAERHPKASPKGLLMYGMNRMMTIRRWRRPGPRIDRGEPY